MKNRTMLKTKLATAAVIASAAMGAMGMNAMAAELDTEEGIECEFVEEVGDIVEESSNETSTEEVNEEAREEAPSEEVNEEAKEEAPSEEVKEEVKEEAPAEEVSEEVREEAPAEEVSEEVREEANEAIREDMDSEVAQLPSTEVVAPGMTEEVTSAVSACCQICEAEDEAKDKADLDALDGTKYNKKTGAPIIREETLGEKFTGYSGKRVDYDKVELGKFYLMQWHDKPGLITPGTFSFRIVKFNKIEKTNYLIVDKVDAHYVEYDRNGNTDNKHCQSIVNNTIFWTPAKIYEITDDIFANK